MDDANLLSQVNTNESKDNKEPGVQQPAGQQQQFVSFTEMANVNTHNLNTEKIDDQSNSNQFQVIQKDPKVQRHIDEQFKQQNLDKRETLLTPISKQNKNNVDQSDYLKDGKKNNQQQNGKQNLNGKIPEERQTNGQVHFDQKLKNQEQVVFDKMVKNQDRKFLNQAQINAKETNDARKDFHQINVNNSRKPTVQQKNQAPHADLHLMFPVNTEVEYLGNGYRPRHHGYVLPTEAQNQSTSIIVQDKRGTKQRYDLNDVSYLRKITWLPTKQGIRQYVVQQPVVGQVFVQQAVVQQPVVLVAPRPMYVVRR